MMRKQTAMYLLGTVILLFLMVSMASAQGIHVTGPVSGAIVRETVKFYVDPSDLPGEGYVEIDLDGAFKAAQVLPDDIKAPVYEWDTKAPFTTSDDPDTKQFVKDGPHTVTVSIYGEGSKLIGSDTVTINVANEIHMHTGQGVMLSYHWREDEVLKYARQTKLAAVSSGVRNTLQASSIQFLRSVEDVSDGEALIRDKVMDGGTVISGGQSSAVDAAYVLKSDYRDVSPHGSIQDTLPPLTPGSHFGFSIPTLPARRVNIGDSWASPVQVSLAWATDKPATIVAQSTLEGFEWQDRYPTARFRETYKGPVTFTGLDGKPIKLDSINFERIVYFAYNSGRLVETDTTLSVPGSLTSDQINDLGLNSTGDTPADTGAPAASGQAANIYVVGKDPLTGQLIYSDGTRSALSSVPAAPAPPPVYVTGRDPATGNLIWSDGESLPPGQSPAAANPAPTVAAPPTTPDNGGGTAPASGSDGSGASSLEYTEKTDILTGE